MESELSILDLSAPRRVPLVKRRSAHHDRISALRTGLAEQSARFQRDARRRQSRVPFVKESVDVYVEPKPKIPERQPVRLGLERACNTTNRCLSACANLLSPSRDCSTGKCA